MSRKKSVTLLVVGALIIASVFSALPLTYPSSGPSLQPHIFLNQKNSTFLQKFEGRAPGNLTGKGQPYNFSKLGFFGKILSYVYNLFSSLFHFISGTSSSSSLSSGFSPSAGGPVSIHGYVRDSSDSNRTITNSILFVSSGNIYVSVPTNLTGYYNYTMLHQGKGTLTYFISGYNPQVVTVNTLDLSSLWLNVTLTKATEYNVAGSTELSNGTAVSYVNVTFHNIVSNYEVQSGPTGNYSVNLPNGTYIIVVSKPGMNSTPRPEAINVPGNSINNFNIKITPEVRATLIISGFVLNKEMKTVVGATVELISGDIISHSNSYGYYSLSVPYGMDQILAFANGYESNLTTVYVKSNLSNVNLTLVNKDPILGGANSSNRNLTQLGESNINYTAGPSNITLEGNISSTLFDRPVSNTSFIFYVKVNSTLFYINLTTNSTGYYDLYLSYPGNYKFEVTSSIYYSYFFNITIKVNSTYNFSVTPLPGYIFSITGYVKAELSGSPLSGSRVELFNGNGILLDVNISSTNGKYEILGVKGHYELIAMAFGFNQSHPVKVNLYRNITDLNFTLNVSYSIGNGIVHLGNNFSSGIPWENGFSIGSSLGAGSGSSFGNGGGPIAITFHLKNNTGSLINTNFVLFLEVDYQRYMFVNITNETGNFTLKLNITGNFTVLADTLYNKGNPTVVDTQRENHVVLTLQSVPVYSDWIRLENSYSQYYPGDSVPVNYLNETSFVLPIHYVYNSVDGNVTIYRYVLPQGNYTFSYSNAHFVPKNFTSNITNHNVTVNISVNPYLIQIESNSTSSWYYEINRAIKNETIGSQDIVLPEANGTYLFGAGLIRNGTISIYNKDIELTPLKNIFIVNMTMKNKTYSTDNTTTVTSHRFIYVNGSIDLNPNDYVSSAELSFNLSNGNLTNFFFYYQGKSVNISFSDGIIEMHNYLATYSNPGYFNITIEEANDNFSVHYPMIFSVNYVNVIATGKYM